MAEWERKIIGSRTREALAACKAAGVQLGRPRQLDPAIADGIRAERASGATFQSIAERPGDHYSNGAGLVAHPCPQGRFAGPRAQEHCGMTNRRHFGDIRKLHSGRYQASYSHEGQRHVGPNTFAAKADAQAWLARAEGDLARGSWIAPGGGGLTVAEVAERWLASNPVKRSSTVERDRAIIEAHITKVLGDRRIDQITRAEVQAVVDGWATMFAASTVGRMASVLRAIYTYAIYAELVGRSPVNGIRLPHVGLVERPTLSAEDLDRLAGALGADQAPMMWLGVVGGLRWAECAGLTVDNFGLLAGTIAVGHQLGRDLRLGRPKSIAGLRRLAIPVCLVDDLAAYLACRALTDCQWPS